MKESTLVLFNETKECCLMWPLWYLDRCIYFPIKFHCIPQVIRVYSSLHTWRSRSGKNKFLDFVNWVRYSVSKQKTNKWTNEETKCYRFRSQVRSKLEPLQKLQHGVNQCHFPCCSLHKELVSSVCHAWEPFFVLYRE